MTVVVPNVPTPVPSRADPANFAVRADAYHEALPDVVEAMNLQNAENNQINAYVSATSASVALVANVSAWSSTTNYAAGVCVFDPVDFLTYRRKVAGVSASRPGLDATRWQLLTGFGDVTLTGVQTLTNKTLTAPDISGLVVTDGTANAIPYLNSSKQLVSGVGLTFNGTSLGVGTAAPSVKLDVTAGSVSNFTVQSVAQLKSNSDVNGNAVEMLLTPVFSGQTRTAIGAAREGITSNAAVYFSTNNAERLRITSSGTLRLVDNDSAGIQFPATQVAVANANTLDDYEEGTFVPTVVGSTTAGSGTESVVGRYTKIGNRVLFTLVITWSAHTGTGNLRINGLPFTSQATTSNTPPMAILSGNLTFTGQLTARVANNTSQVHVHTMSTGGPVTDLPMDASGTLYLSGHYEV